MIKIKKRTYVKKDGRIIKLKEEIKNKNSDNNIIEMNGNILNNNNTKSKMFLWY